MIWATLFLTPTGITANRRKAVDWDPVGEVPLGSAGYDPDDTGLMTIEARDERGYFILYRFCGRDYPELPEELQHPLARAVIFRGD